MSTLSKSFEIDKNLSSNLTGIINLLRYSKSSLLFSVTFARSSREFKLLDQLLLSAISRGPSDWDIYVYIFLIHVVLAKDGLWKMTLWISSL